MFKEKTISIHLLKSFLSCFVIVSFAVICIFLVSCIFDILQKFKFIDMNPAIFWRLILSKIPYLYNEISTLVCFISSLLFFQKIVNNNEMIILLTSGLVRWKIFLIPIIVNGIIGVMILFIISPIGAYGLKYYDILEDGITNKFQNNLAVSKYGIYFFEERKDCHYVLQAKSINIAKHELMGVALLIIDHNNKLITKIDAKKAKLYSDFIEFDRPVVISDQDIKHPKKIKIDTNLSIDKLVQKFVSPEKIFIWSLKTTIENMNNSGVAVINYKIYYSKQILRPLFIVAMTIFSCVFISTRPRNANLYKIFVFGLFVGIAVYFVAEITLRVLSYSGIDPLAATLSPILLIAFLSVFVILHFIES